MVTTAHHPSAHETQQAARAQKGDATHQAYVVLRTAFVLAPIIFGLDKFTNLLVHWDQYLAPVLSQRLPVTPHQAMYAVGVIEVVEWRSCRLREGGFPPALANSLARKRVDLHALLELVDAGCPAELAARILSPLDDVDAAVHVDEPRAS